jgi:hypothetical protein
MGTGNALADSLSAITAGSGGRANVMRAWFFQRFATVSGHRDWSALDHTIAAARAKGFLVIPVLGNQWGIASRTKRKRRSPGIKMGSDPHNRATWSTIDPGWRK